MFHRSVRNDGCSHKAVGDVDVERGSQRDEADWGVGCGGCGGGFQKVVGGFPENYRRLAGPREVQRVRCFSREA